MPLSPDRESSRELRAGGVDALGACTSKSAGFGAALSEIAHLAACSGRQSVGRMGGRARSRSCSPSRRS